MRGLVRSLLLRIERLPAGPAGLAALFAATVIGRNVLEGASAGVLFPPSAFLLHFPVAYAFPMLGIAAMMAVLSGYPAAKMLRLMVYAWTLTLLPPLIDLVAGVRAGIGYFPLDRGNILRFLAGFFDPSVSLPGTTAGIRAEAALGCLLAGLFVGCVAGRAAVLRGILTAVLFFPLFLLFFTWPQLLHMAFQPLFPAAEQVQDFLQWHAITPPQLTGTVHDIVFLADMWPVMALAAWFWPRISPGTWMEVRRAAGRALVPGLAPAAAGLAAVCIQASRIPATFADAATISGAFAAACLAALSAEAEGPAAAVTASAALLEASAGGWQIAVAALAALAAGRLPVPRRARRTLSSPLLLVLAASPVFMPPESLVRLAIPAAGAAAAGFLSVRRRLGAVAALAALALVAVIRPVPSESSSIWFYSDITESFARSSRNAHAHVSSSLLAASGGPLLPLAEASQLDGDPARAEWVCELAIMGGDSSADILKVKLNIALERDDTTGFAETLGRLEASRADMGDLPLAILRSAALSADTSMLLQIHRFTGPSALFLSAYAEAKMALGDTSGAVGLALGAASRPDAGVSEYAYAIEVTGVAATGCWDSVYEEGRRRFGVSPTLMLARIRAPILAGEGPDRPDLVSTCLSIAPVSTEVLETCASWMLASGRPDSALRLAERSVLAQTRPELRSFLLACSCAEAAGDAGHLAALLRYARSEYPLSDRLSRYEGMDGQGHR